MIDLKQRGMTVINTKNTLNKELQNISEDKLQANCVRWFKTQYPKLSMRIFAIPNGGSRNIIEASKLKRTGTLSGVADLFLAVPKMGYGGLFIEMKRAKGQLSENQKKFFVEMCYDYRCVVCRSLEDFIREIKDYLE